MITLFVSKDFFWVDRVNNIFVFPGQVFLVKDPAYLPRPTNADDWQNYYSMVNINA